MSLPAYGPLTLDLSPHVGPGQSGRGRTWPSVREWSFSKPHRKCLGLKMWGQRAESLLLYRDRSPGPGHSWGPSQWGVRCYFKAEAGKPLSRGWSTEVPAPVPSLGDLGEGPLPSGFRCFICHLHKSQRPHKSGVRPQKVHEDENAFVNTEEIQHWEGFKRSAQPGVVVPTCNPRRLGG